MMQGLRILSAQFAGGEIECTSEPSKGTKLSFRLLLEYSVVARRPICLVCYCSPLEAVVKLRLGANSDAFGIPFLPSRDTHIYQATSKESLLSVLSGRSQRGRSQHVACSHTTLHAHIVTEKQPSDSGEVKRCMARFHLLNPSVSRVAIRNRTSCTCWRFVSSIQLPQDTRQC